MHRRFSLLRRSFRILNSAVFAMPVIMRVGGGGASSGMPSFTYTGSYSLIDDGSKNWRIKFLTSGTLTFISPGTGGGLIDVFCVGGGGGGSSQTAYGTGGGGGYTITSVFSAARSVGYAVVVGAGGSAGGTGGTSSFNTTISASGGGYGVGGSDNGSGGSGGSGGGGNGGSGGSNGANGIAASSNAGRGQGTTTREFAESAGTLYSGGGGGSGGSGGSGGGGAALTAGYTNLGGGGGSTKSGGSGIVIIRNHRS